jgi:drug/metabolite transporter (DMT)-like permease
MSDGELARGKQIDSFIIASLELEDDVLQAEISESKQLSRAYLAFGFGILVISFSAIFVRSANAPGTITAFYRMAIGSLLMVLPFAGDMRRKQISTTRQGIWLSILAGVFFGLDLAFWSTGIMIGGAAIPTLMANTAPLWVGLGAWLIFREQQNGIFWLGLLLAMAGSGIILGQDYSPDSGLGMGGVFGLLAGVFYGAYYLVTQKARLYVRTLPYFWITTTTSALFLILVNLGLGRSFWGYDRTTLGYFLAVGVLVQVLGWLSINFAQGFIPAPIISATLLIQPVMTAIIAWFLLDEGLTLWQIFGGVAVIVGIFIVHRSKNGLNWTLNLRLFGKGFKG